MDKEQFQSNVMMFENGIIDYVTFTQRCLAYIKELEQQVEVLSFKIDAQNVTTHEYSDENVNLAKAMGFIK